ncbi:MAG: alpha amylase C-terminal domain-containing protein, partial [Oscillospiraceae bacterium]|nr:alpha amylase C-terminal domain-containing protein [Oscillospiraceae bacterium]
MAHPGKKLNFMGNEFSQVIEWNYKQELDWMLLQYDTHQRMHRFFEDINKFYLENTPMWHNDDSWEGFKWISAYDYTQSIIAFRRIDTTDPENPQEIIIICNFVPVTRFDYKIGVPYEGTYEQVFSTDDLKYGGSGEIDNGRIKSREEAMHGCDHSISVDIPGLSAIYLKYVPKKKKAPKSTEVIDVTDTAKVKKTAPKRSTAAKKPAASTRKKAAAEPAETAAAPKKRGRPKKT